MTTKTEKYRDEPETRKALENAWSNFCDANPDDLTSPEDLPDHALMTCEQFVSYALSALATPPEKHRHTECPYCGKVDDTFHLCRGNEKHRHTAEGVRWSDHHGTIRCASYSCERYALNYMEAGGVGSYYCNECRIEIQAVLAPTRHTAEVEALIAALQPFMPIETHDTPDYAELRFGTHETQAMTVRPLDWQALNDAFAALATQPTPTTAEKP